MIDVDDYQTKAMKFRLPTANATYALLNLAGEVGEVTSLAAKFIRDGDQYPEDYRKSMKKELGEFGCPTWWIFGCRGNMDKLQSRKDRDVIKGSGNER